MNMIRKSILAALLLAAACPALPAEAGPRAGTYPWERRAGRPTASDAVLCYGNSHHRNPYPVGREAVRTLCHLCR